jgi:hypothetical protein
MHEKNTKTRNMWENISKVERSIDRETNRIMDVAHVRVKKL